MPRKVRLLRGVQQGREPGDCQGLTVRDGFQIMRLGFHEQTLGIRGLIVTARAAHVSMTDTTRVRDIQPRAHVSAVLANSMAIRAGLLKQGRNRDWQDFSARPVSEVVTAAAQAAAAARFPQFIDATIAGIDTRTSHRNGFTVVRGILGAAAAPQLAREERAFTQAFGGLPSDPEDPCNTVQLAIIAPSVADAVAHGLVEALREQQWELRLGEPSYIVGGIVPPGSQGRISR